MVVGAWRSLVAHLSGGQGVASSNLAVPTNKNNVNICTKITKYLHHCSAVSTVFPF